MKRPQLTIGDAVRVKKGAPYDLTVVGLDFEDEENPKVKLRNASGQVSNWGSASKVERDPEALPDIVAVEAPAPVAAEVARYTAPAPRKRAAKRAPATTKTVTRRSNSPHYNVISAGFYALADVAGNYTGYMVVVPEKGNWAGYRFIKRVLPDGTTSRVAVVDEALDLLDRIAQDPDRARTAYTKHVKIKV